MKPNPLQVAVMNIAEGEELFGGWATPSIPQVGIYKLLAKKKADAPLSGCTSSSGTTVRKKRCCAAR